MNHSYRVTVKVRNANLLNAIEKSGLKNRKEFCVAAGISYSFLNELINLKAKPIDINGDYKPEIINLCVFLNVMPCKLFDEDQMYMRLENNVFSFDNSLAQITQLSIDQKKLQIVVESILDGFTQNEQRVISARFGLNTNEKTLKEIGDDFGISSERVRQIEIKALRKLRHPRNSIVLKEFIEVAA